MAENSSAGEKGIFGKKILQKLSRTKQLVRQNIWTGNRTTDSDFDQLVTNFTEQHHTANHLLKELKNYMGQVKAMSVASHSMYQAVAESYETSWKNADEFLPATEELIGLWDDYLEKLNNDLKDPLSKYIDQFRDVKKKIEKRSRKLTSFDGERHNVESLENAKKRDEVKISKAHEEMNKAKSVYEAIHNELFEELPALYQSRIPTLCSYFALLFRSEADFQSRCAKIKTRLAELIEGETETVARSPAMKAPTNKTPPRPPTTAQRSTDIPERLIRSETVDVDQSHDYLTLVEIGGNATNQRIPSESSENEDEGNDRKQAPQPSSVHLTGSAKKTVSATSSNSSSSGRLGGDYKGLDAAANPKSFHSSDSSVESSPKNALKTDGMTESPLASSEASIDRKGSKASIEEELLGGKESNDKDADGAREAAENGKDSDDGAEGKRLVNVRNRKSSSSVEETAAGVTPSEESAFASDVYMYKVVAIHDYTAEDADELSFEKGELIGVLPFEDASEEQDEGWLFGVKSSTGEKGVFPMNFTSKA